MPRVGGDDYGGKPESVSPVVVAVVGPAEPPKVLRTRGPSGPTRPDETYDKRNVIRSDRKLCPGKRKLSCQSVSG